MNWQTYQSCQALPEAWDQLAGSNLFLGRDFLAHLEKVNPCGQAYHLLADERGLIQGIYIDYSLNLDIFTYSFLKLKVPVRIMGIPCSLAKQGFSMHAGLEGQLMSHFGAKAGAKLILNCDSKLPGKPGTTLPSCRLVNHWPSFDSYLQALRSHYRYRTKQALQKWKGVAVEIVPPSAFDQAMYKLYEQVYNRSQVKLEKLSWDFFNKITIPAKIIKASYAGALLGFALVVENHQELIFLFTGFNHQLNAKFDIYNNLLLEIVKYGLRGNFAVIDFGQTAEETKLKLGCQLLKKGMYIKHSNGFLNYLGNKYIDFLSYQEPKFQFHVFK